VLRIFIALKKFIALARFEPATFGSSGKHINQYTTKSTYLLIGHDSCPPCFNKDYNDYYFHSKHYITSEYSARQIDRKPMEIICIHTSRTSLVPWKYMKIIASIHAATLFLSKGCVKSLVPYTQNTTRIIILKHFLQISGKLFSVYRLL
jgi:hypothetical protein